MSEIEELYAEIGRLSRLADDYELMYLRAAEGSRGHQRGLERALRRAARLESELRLERASKTSQIGRLLAENESLKKKAERLSLRLIAEWSRNK